MSKTSKPTKPAPGSEVAIHPKISGAKSSVARLAVKAPSTAAAAKSKANKASTQDDRPTRASGSTSKLAEIIAMLRTKQGVSIDQIAETVGWQRHSVHGLISANIRKKLGLNVVSEKVDGTRLYRIAK